MGLCGLFGYSRQSLYKHKSDNDFAENSIEPLIVEKARDYRADNPGLGCAKLYRIIKNLFGSTGCMPGRDAFIEVLRSNGLMVQIKRRRHYKTTDTGHQYHKYPNLIKGVVPLRPNEIRVGDITYVETAEGVCYLSLITDAYSHKTVGWAVGKTQETVYPLNALRMALGSIDDTTTARLTHHSDRGCQYCSAAYVSELKSHNIKISMTQSGDPLENAIAERANGILWDRMAIQDEHCLKGGMPKRTWTNHPVLQHRAPAHEHRVQDSLNSPRRAGRTKALLAKSPGHAERACRQRIGFLSHGCSLKSRDGAARMRGGSVKSTRFQCSAVAYCWRVAPQQSPLLFGFHRQRCKKRRKSKRLR